MQMKVYEGGYSIHSGQITALMKSDPALLLIDVRRSPNSQLAAWKRSYLIETYGDRYGWFGESLGNINYKTGGPICLANPEPGITHLVDLLYQGWHLLILCGCANYQTCHRRAVIDLLQRAAPEITVIHPDQVAHPGMVRVLSIRQPWPWLICHPETVKSCRVPIKDIENRTWRPDYQGPLYIHAGTAIDASLFTSQGQLESWYWERKFGTAGQALYAAMPKHKDDYPRRAIVGQAQLTGVVTSSSSPWFNGPYGLILANAQAINPTNYPGSLKIFEIPASILEAT